MKISYAVTVVDEHIEIQRLINFLLKHKRTEDEIVVLFDESKNCNAVEEYLRSHSVNDEFSWHGGQFKGHFADWKNHLNSLCNGDWIIQLDADEIPSNHFMESIHKIIEINPEVDLYFVPRENFVEGITQEHISKWGWRLDEKNRINYPDAQMRVYRNTNDIKWVNKVHEVIDGYKTLALLPESLCLYHYKTISRQEKQNSYYNTL